MNNDNKLLCPNCAVELVKHSIVKYKHGGRFNIVGYHYYCSKLGCDFEKDIRGLV